MRNYILYLAAGNIHRINECRYSLLKYLAVYNLKSPADVAVLIYTDAPAMFESFEPFFEQFELKEIPDNLTKLELIKNVLSEKKGNLLFMDADSYFTIPVNTVFNDIEEGKALFYKQSSWQAENRLGDIQKIKEYLLKNTITIEGEKIFYSDQQHFYSTEVIGINENAESLIKNIYDLYSQLAASDSNLPLEEFACSYFASNVQVQTVQNGVTNYRGFPQFKKLLQLFFEKNEEESIPNLVKLVHHIDAQIILQEKNRYDSQPFVKKILSALSGKAWSVRQYQNKF